ncbi:MAG: ABC-2 family transporter protein, partial [Candidatus Muiribacteriaceae bacterium]
ISLVFLNISLLSLRFMSVGSFYSFVMSIMQIAKFPHTIFSDKGPGYLLFFIPVAVIASFPVSVLRGMGNIRFMVSVSGILSLVLFCITLLNYRLNIRKYHSVA